MVLFGVIKREFPWVFSFASIAAINCPWYLTMAAKHGKIYLSTFFGYHNIERFTQGVNHHGGRPWWYGLAVVGVGFFPWCLWIPSAISRAILSARARTMWQASVRSSRLPLFATIWYSCVYTFFTLSSSKLPSYYLPLAPAIAMLASSQLISEYKFNVSRSSTSNLLSIGGAILPGLLYFAISGAFFTLPSLLENSGDLPREGEPLIMVGTRMPSVVFYSRRPVAFFDKLEEAESVVQHEAAPGIRSAVAIVEKSLWTPGTRTMAYDELQQKGDYILLRMLRAIGNSVSHNWAKVGRGETTSIGSAEGSREASYWGQMLKLWKDIFPSRVKEPRTREEVLCQPLFCSARIRDIQGKPLTLTARATKWGTWVEHGVLQINHLMGGREEAVEDSQGTRSGTERKPQTVEKPQRSSGIDPAGMDRTATKETSVGARRSGHMAAGGTTMGNVQNLEPGARKDECG
ncbi:hypothetical protein CBR_g41664 [Chara braunii]|uniref:Mannosyltransferase n=1 Tax=Chara braunii TaxID=69332 RepID=A0A388LWK8_CHABU|nr:hypothetical protein CBR_g41664 [Chara braunii]|eukprot:GBG86599.1 hypothetical protein CBR_g41664 [Chara braunii]